MRRSNRFVARFVVVALVAAGAAGSCTARQDSAGQYLDVSVVTARVKSLLAEDDMVSVFQVSVATFRGIVRLSGSAGSQEAVDQAGRIALGVPGVNAVENDMTVQ
jgi:osmotically-inducible protein OsmY